MALEYVSPMCDICNRVITRFDLPEVLSVIVKTAAEGLNAKGSVIRLFLKQPPALLVMLLREPPPVLGFLGKLRYRGFQHGDDVAVIDDPPDRF